MTTKTDADPPRRRKAAAGATATAKSAATAPRSATKKPAGTPRKRAARPAAPGAATTTPAPGNPAGSLLKKVSERNRKNVATAMELTRSASFRMIDSQRAIWLAGLGALAQASVAAGKRGEQAFQTLVKAGEALEAQAKTAVDGGAERLKEGIGTATNLVDRGFNRATDAFDSRVEQALARLGVPSGDAFRQLYERLNDLTKTLERKVSGK